MVHKLCPSALLLTAVALTTLTASKGFSANPTSSLTVEIDGLKNRNGEVCLNIFASSRGFPNRREDALQRQCVSITEIPLRVTFNNLSPGSYAVAAFHDANGDHQLNRNFLGMPVEGLGFSGNPIIRTGPPRFGECVFVVAGANNSLQIQLQYLGDN
jgi:uncharacterized protein (DUF2141 family)